MLKNTFQTAVILICLMLVPAVHAATSTYGWENGGTILGSYNDDEGSHNGLVIEVRTYSNPGDTVWIDDLTVTAPDTATITTPVPLPAALWLLGSDLIGLVGIRRNVRLC